VRSALAFLRRSSSSHLALYENRRMSILLSEALYLSAEKRTWRRQLEVSLTYGKGCSPEVRSLQEATFQEPLHHGAGIRESDFGTGDVPQKRHHE
jgi:hypothetical protein